MGTENLISNRGIHQVKEKSEQTMVRYICLYFTHASPKRNEAQLPSVVWFINEALLNLAWICKANFRHNSKFTLESQERLVWLTGEICIFCILDSSCHSLNKKVLPQINAIDTYKMCQHQFLRNLSPTCFSPIVIRQMVAVVMSNREGGEKVGWENRE